MIEKTIFEKLSGELDDQDREALYQNLRRGVVASEAETREDTGRDKAGPGGDSGESKMVQKALARESFFARAWIWLLARLTVQKEESIFITQKLKQLRRDISQKAPGITVFEMRQLTPAFAKEVFSLFRFCAMVKPYFDYIWLGPGKFEELVVYLLTQKISLKKEKLDDFLSMEDLVAIFSRGGQKDTLKKELLSRLTGYVESIPDADVAEAEAALEPFYYLREAVQFPFAGFFQFFGYDCRNQAIGEEPGFQNASVMLLLRFVEKLCIAGEMNEFLTPPLEPNEGFLRCLIKRQGSSPVQAAGEEENIKNEEEFKALRENLQELNRRIAKFYKKLPLLDILRFYKREPFFVVTRKIPGLHFRDFYFMNLKNSLVKEVETRFTEIRIEYLQHELDKFFAQTDKYALEYYRNYSSIDYEKTGAPFFKYIQSINLLYNYIRNFLYLNFHDLVQIIIKNVLGSNRSLKERLERAYACLEETEEAIRRLDLSMSPDSEDGKLFQRLRYSLGTDPGHHKIFMGLVVQKDQDVKGILDQGLENLNALAKVLEEVEGITTSEGKIQLSTHYMIQGQSDKLCRHIDARREHMDRFRGFFQQIYKHEKTSH